MPSLAVGPWLGVIPGEGSGRHGVATAYTLKFALFPLSTVIMTPHLRKRRAPQEKAEKRREQSLTMTSHQRNDTSEGLALEGTMIATSEALKRCPGDEVTC